MIFFMGNKMAEALEMWSIMANLMLGTVAQASTKSWKFEFAP